MKSSVPSRHANPFATCWTRPGAIPFRFENGVNAELLTAQLAAQNWRGAIIGPHGSGKSTLLETLKPALTAAGRNFHFIALRDHQRHLPREAFAALERVATNRLLIVDGYEQLARLERVRLAWHCHRRECGLLVTAHASVSLPTLITLTPSPALVEQLVGNLCAEVSTPVTTNQVTASHARHGSNVREIFFDLYDHYEQVRRIGRTSVAHGAYSNPPS